VVAKCRTLGIGTVGFYVLGFNTDTWDSIAPPSSISISLGSTLAQFKVLTPYPGTPSFKQMESRSSRRTGSASTGSRRRTSTRT
jgi:hypothetical protein